MSPRKPIAERVVVEQVKAQNQGLSERIEDNGTFEDTVIKVEVYESEREITRVIQDYVPNTSEEQRLVRKIDLRLLPILGAIYVLQSMDRTGMHGAKLAAKAREYYQDSTMYTSISWLLMLSYILVVVLSNITLSHSRPSRYLPGMVLAAGIIGALMSNTGSVRSFLMVRIPLAAFEAAFYPGALYVLSCWYKPRELGKRIAIFPTISIITQLVGMGITRYGPERLPISSIVSIWRTVFLADGLVTIAVALLAYLLLPDYPATTRSFSRRERELATIRLVRRGQDTGSSTSRGVERLRRTDSIIASIADPRVHLVLFVTFFAMAAGTLGHLLTTTTVQTGYNALRGHYMAVPVYVISAFVLNLLAWSSDIMRERRWHMVMAIAMAIVGVTVAKSNISGGAKMTFATLFAAGIWSALHQAFTYAATSIRAPAEKRAVVLALVHAVGGTATIVSGSMHPRMMGTRSGVNMIMSWMFLGLAILAIAIVPSLYHMDNYRGTRAERALESRRRACTDIREKEVLLAEDDDVLDY